jgi:hypothetical protein
MTTILDVMRRDSEMRAASDESVASELRARLEVCAHEATLVRAPHGDLANVASSMGRVRGMLVHQLLRLAAAGYDWRNPAVDAMAAWRASAPRELVEEVARFEPDERAQLRADLEAHAVVLRRALGPLPASWLPRSAMRTRTLVGHLTLVDVVDLMVGVVGPRASVALVDVTSSPLGADAEDRVAYHALCQTLRTMHVPLASAILSTATGEILSRDVDAQLLERGASYVASAVSRE